MENLAPLDREMSINYVETPFLKGICERAISYLNAGYPIHLRGAAGVGKTSLAFHIAEKIGREIIFMCGSEEFSDFDMVGGYFGAKKAVIVDNYISTVFKKEEEVKKMWLDGRLITACRNGFTLIYDEFTRARPEANNVLLSVLEERMMELPNTYSGGSYLKVHPDFKAIFTSNPDEYAGVYKSPNALLDRMITIDIDRMDNETEKAIIMAQSGIGEREAARIMRISRFMRDVYRDKGWVSIRCSIMLAKIVKSCGVRVSPEDHLFKKICMDIYNSSCTNSILSVVERDRYNELMAKALNTAFVTVKEENEHYEG